MSRFFVPARACLWGLAVAAVALAVMMNGLDGPFVFDDKLITGDPAVHEFRGREWLHGRPVHMFSLWLNYHFGQLEPRGYHAVNIAVHVLAACFLFGIVRRTLSLVSIDNAKETDRAIDWPRHANLLAGGIAAAWAVHPLQTESVTYIVQRCESMMGMFFFAALYFLLRGATSSGRRWPWHLAAAASCYLSMGSKEVGVMLPFVALLFDRLFLARSWREVVQRRWPLYAAMGLGLIWEFRRLSPLLIDPLVAAPSSESSAPSPHTAGFGVQSITPWMYLRSQPAVIFYYLRLTLWPDVLKLDPLWPVEEHPFRVYVLGSFIVAMLVGSGWLYLRGNAAGFLGLAFFLVLAPTSSFIPIHDLAFEHRMYVPLAAVVALLVLGLAWLIRELVETEKQAMRILAVVLVCWIIALGIRTVRRNQDYYGPYGPLFGERPPVTSPQRDLG